MSNPFTDPSEPFAGRPGFGFGFGCGPTPELGIAPTRGGRRAMHDARRHARREFFEQLRDHAGDHDGPMGFGPGFGPGFGGPFGFGPVVDAAGAALVVDAAAPGADVAVTCAPPFWCCWPSNRCTATR